MVSHSVNHSLDPVLGVLADFRYELRRFLEFSERAAKEAGLQTKQYQLMLQIAGAREALAPSIAFTAQRLCLRHNSVVELVDRCEHEGLLERMADPEDRRRTILKITRKGWKILARLAGDHARELNERAPQLIRSLRQIQLHSQAIGPEEMQ